MDHSHIFIIVIELMGTIAFAISGAMVAVRCGMDLLGVIVLGVVTAVGGGMIRDIVLGNIPSALTDPIYVLTAVIVSVLVFLLVFFRRKILSDGFHPLYARLIEAMDALGLGIFSALGVLTGIRNGHLGNTFLLVFLGTMTGVGGGMLRDMMAQVPLQVLYKRIYACASIVGALSCTLLYPRFGEAAALFVPLFLVLIIRLLAAHHRWDLPRIPRE